MTSVILIVKWHGVLNHADTIKVGRKDSRCQCNECCVTWSSKREKNRAGGFREMGEAYAPPPHFFRLWPNKKQNVFHHKNLYHWLTPLPPNFQIFLRLCKDNESFALDFAEGGPRDFLDCILRTKSIEGSYISDVITWLSNLEGIYMLELRSYTDFVLLSFKVTTKR